MFVWCISGIILAGVEHMYSFEFVKKEYWAKARSGALDQLVSMMQGYAESKPLYDEACSDGSNDILEVVYTTLVPAQDDMCTSEDEDETTTSSASSSS